MSAGRDLPDADGARLVTPEQRDAFEAECMPHQPALLGTAVCICKNRAEAEDLVQETLLHAMVGWESFKPGTNARAWLYRILTNTFITDYRKRKVRRQARDSHHEEIAFALHDATPDERLEPVHQILRDLRAVDRDIVVRAYILGMRRREIASELGIPVNTVMTRLFRARRALLVTLSDYLPSRPLEKNVRGSSRLSSNKPRPTASMASF